MNRERTWRQASTETDTYRDTQIDRQTDKERKKELCAHAPFTLVYLISKVMSIKLSNHSSGQRSSMTKVL